MPAIAKPLLISSTRKQTNISRLLVTLVIIFHSCSPIREAVVPDPTRHTINETLSGMRENETRFHFLHTRFSGSASIDGTEYSISGTLRIKHDSAIFVSVAPLLGIEIARLLITPDTVKMVNRLENTFYAGNIEVLNRMFNTSVDYYMLQALLVGNDFSHFATTGFNLSHHDDHLVLFSENRSLVGGTASHRFQNRLLLSSDTYRIMENLVYETAAQRSLQVKYHRFSRVDDQVVPEDISLVFSGADGQAGIRLQFSRTVLNEERSMVFTIPGHYREIHL